MARQIIQQIWCDVCIKHAEDDGQDPVYVDGVEESITLGAMRMRTPAFCPVHMKEYIEPLRELLRDLPVAETASTPARAQQADAGQLLVLCQECGNTLTGKGSFGSHVRQMHELTIPQYRAKYPEQDLGWRATGRPRKIRDDADQLPLDTQSADEDVVTEACSECGKEYTYRKNRIRQVMGVHMAKAHGIRGATKK